jgi:hypothetical protein
MRKLSTGVEVVAGHSIVVWLLRTLNHENVSWPAAARLSRVVSSMKLLTAQRTARHYLKEVHLPIRTDCCIFFNFSISMIAVARLSSEAEIWGGRSGDCQCCCTVS